MGHARFSRFALFLSPLRRGHGSSERESQARRGKHGSFSLAGLKSVPMSLDFVCVLVSGTGGCAKADVFCGALAGCVGVAYSVPT